MDDTHSTDLSQLYSTLSVWTFKFSEHYEGLVPEKLCALCQTVEANLVAQGQNYATEFETKDIRTASDYLMRNKNQFTIANFMSCFDISSKAYNELSAAIFGNAAAAHNVSVEDSELATLRAQVQKLQFDKTALEQKQSAMIAREVAQGIKNLQIPPSQSGSQSTAPTGLFQFSNPAPNNNNPTNSSPILSNPPPSSTPLLPAMSNPDPNLTIGSLSLAMERLTRLVESNIVNSQNEKDNFKRVEKISKDPPIYIRKQHGSMRKFGRKQFSWWVRGQCMSQRQSVQFFCLCFSSDIEKAHVDKIALDHNGNSKFASVFPLIERVIEDLQFDEETGEQLRLRFDLYRAKAGTRLDAEFMRCIELREEGWPNEGEAECYRNARYHFSRRLALGDDLHDLLHNHCKTFEWSNAANYFESSAQLRELQNLFNSARNANGVSSSSKPTNYSQAPIAMDTTNNMGIIGSVDQNSQVQVQNQTQQSQVPPQQQQQPAQAPPTFNNVSKTCRNEVCKKPFTASNPKFYCCSKECVAVWKLKRYGPEDQAKKKGSKAFNNMTAANNNSTSTNSVSKLKKYYITPCHVYLPGIKDPTVIDNSLFDTGAGLTFITHDFLKKLKMEGALIRDPGGGGCCGGDRSPMMKGL